MPGCHTSPSRSRRRFLADLAAVATVIGTGCKAFPVRTPLRVLTYNLHHGEGVDGRVDLPRIASVIRAAQPDIVALQELDRRTRRTGGVDQPAVLAELTDLLGQFGAAMPFRDGEYGQALLSRWPLHDFEVLRLPNPSKREPRIAVTAWVEVAQGSRVRITGVHLDHVASDTDRWEQAGQLIAALAGKPRLPMLLAGDFNDIPASRVLGRFIQAGWMDTAGATASPTVPAEAPKSRIDYVLAFPAAAWQAVDSEVLPEAIASDHRPLRATLQLRGRD